MKRRILNLADMKTIRVRCKHAKCQQVVELARDDLLLTYKNGRCPLCREALQPDAQRNAFTALAELLMMLRESKAEVEIELVVPTLRDIHG